MGAQLSRSPIRDADQSSPIVAIGADAAQAICLNAAQGDQARHKATRCAHID